MEGPSTGGRSLRQRTNQVDYNRNDYGAKTPGWVKLKKPDEPEKADGKLDVPRAPILFSNDLGGKRETQSSRDQKGKAAAQPVVPLTQDKLVAAKTRGRSAPLPEPDHAPSNERSTKGQGIKAAGRGALRAAAGSKRKSAPDTDPTEVAAQHQCKKQHKDTVPIVEDVVKSKLVSKGKAAKAEKAGNRSDSKGKGDSAGPAGQAGTSLAVMGSQPSSAKEVEKLGSSQRDNKKRKGSHETISTGSEAAGEKGPCKQNQAGKAGAAGSADGASGGSQSIKVSNSKRRTSAASKAVAHAGGAHAAADGAPPPVASAAVSKSRRASAPTNSKPVESALPALAPAPAPAAKKGKGQANSATSLPAPSATHAPAREEERQGKTAAAAAAAAPAARSKGNARPASAMLEAAPAAVLTGAPIPVAVAAAVRGTAAAPAAIAAAAAPARHGGQALAIVQQPANAALAIGAASPNNRALPCLVQVGQHDSVLIASQQRQLAELKQLYDDLKAAKIVELEGMLAEQNEYIREQREAAQELVAQATAMRDEATRRAALAGSADMLQKLNELEDTNLQLQLKSSDLELHVQELRRQMAGYEMENHDMRAAALARQEAEAEAEQRGVEPGHVASPQRPAIMPPSTGTQFPSPPLLTAAAAVQPRTSQLMLERGPGDVAMQTSFTSSDARMGMGVGRGLAAPAVAAASGSVHTAAGMGPGTATSSGEPGLSTGIRMVLAQLPLHRELSPSVDLRSRGRSSRGAAEGARGTGMEGGEEHTAAGTIASKGQRSSGANDKSADGSPIDGICPPSELQAVRQMAADASFAASMHASEAHMLPVRAAVTLPGTVGNGARPRDQSHTAAAAGSRRLGLPQTDAYSFVDLDPASATKGACVADPRTTAGAVPDLPVQQLFALGSVLPAELVAAAAQVPLAPSPAPAAAGNIHRPVMAPPSALPPARSAPCTNTAQAPVETTAAAADAAPASPEASNQDSCNGSNIQSALMPLQGRHPAKRAAQPAAAPLGAGAAATGLLLPAVVEAAQPQAGMIGGADSMDLDQHSADAGGNTVPGGCMTPHAVQVNQGVQDTWGFSILPMGPKHYKYTHTATGAIFSLQWVQIEDKEVLHTLVPKRGTAGGTTARADGTEGQAVQEEVWAWEYTPLSLGSAQLSHFLQESMQFMDNQRNAILQRLLKELNA